MTPLAWPVLIVAVTAGQRPHRSLCLITAVTPFWSHLASASALALFWWETLCLLPVSCVKRINQSQQLWPPAGLLAHVKYGSVDLGHSVHGEVEHGVDPLVSLLESVISFYKLFSLSHVVYRTKSEVPLVSQVWDDL